MGDFWKILVGAALAIIGGIIGKFFSVFIETYYESKFIKRSLSDELNEITLVISKFKETFERTSQLVPTYLEQLSANMESYQSCRSRIFVISNRQERTEITTFYRKLKDAIDENQGKLGSLANNANKKTPDSIMSKFTELSTEADALRKKLTSEKFT